jgi:alanine dehydrogenase
MRERGLTRWLDEDDVQRLITLEEAIDVLAQAHRMLADGTAVNLPRGHAAWQGGILHAVGAAIPGLGLAGTKVWTYTPAGAHPLVVLHSTHDGRLLGLVDALALGQLRTAATSGLGTRLLARPEAHTLAIIGTGRQALRQVLAVCAVRKIEAVRIFGRDPQRRAAFAARVRDAVAAEVTHHPTVAHTVEGADVLTTVTRASEPVVGAGHLTPGLHINAVGSITPTARELDVAAVERCDVVAVDSIEQARQDAGELLAAERQATYDWGRVVQLSELVADTAPGRTDERQITLLRALGVGLADVAVAGAILSRAGVTAAAVPT